MTSTLSRLLVVSLLLVGCSGPEQRTPEPEPDAAGQPAQLPQDPADRLLERAARSSGAEAMSLRLQAAALLLERGETARAHAAVAAAPATRLPADLRARQQWLLARIELAEGKAEAALARLSEPALRGAEISADRGLTVDLGRARAEAMIATGGAVDAARELATLQPWLRDDAERATNARAVLAALSEVPMSEIETAREGAGMDDWRAWLDLSAALRDLRIAPALQRQRLQAWQSSNGSLAALETATATLVPEISARITNPSRVALLVPLSGRAGPSGHAVLQGMVAERYRQAQAGDPPPPLAVIDTAAASGGFAAAYARAVEDGATLVIGPLLKEDLAAFGSGLAVRVPTLALNFLDDTVLDQPQLYQFGIDTGDEIDQLARAGRQADLRRVLVLADGSARSRHYADVFSGDWKAGGGTTLGTLYLGEINDYRTQLEQALLLEQSAQRSTALQQVLGMPLASEPRRRADLELFVLLADPPAARSIRSLLTYLYAGDVAVWGTSLSRAGGGAQEGDIDLESLRFLDMPWFAPHEQALRETLAGVVPAGSLERLVALGVDACRMQARLALFEWLPRAGLAGATGELSVVDHGRIRRRSDWYVMHNANAVEERPRELPPSTHSTEGVHAWTNQDGITTTSAPAGAPRTAR